MTAVALSWLVVLLLFRGRVFPAGHGSGRRASPG